MLKEKMIYSCFMERDFHNGETREDFLLRVNRKLNEIKLDDIISINYITEDKVMLTYRKESIVSLIVAKSVNNVIGKEGTIPWHCSRDLKKFKETTMGNIVIMGRKTFESMRSKPLPGRINFVISHKPITRNGIKYSPNLESAINEARLIGEDKEIFIIGGASIYNEALDKDLVHRLYISTINSHITSGDTFFPEFLNSSNAFVTVITYGKTGSKYKMYDSEVFHREESGEEKAIEFTIKKYIRTL